MKALLSEIRNIATLTACMLIFVNPETAHAGAFNMGGLTATLSTDHVTQTERARSINEQVFSTPSIDAGAATRNLDFTYRYSSARTQQNLRNFIARTPDPAARANLEQMFADRPTIITEVGQAVRASGIDPFNVADAYVAWWMTAWYTSQKIDPEPDGATVEAVKRQVYAAFAATPGFANTSDADRQEYAEALLLQMLMLSVAFEQNKNNSAVLSQLAEAARQGAKASGVDLSKMTLTPQGFVPRKGADASGALGDAAERPALAAAEPESESNSSTAFALAMGAGLGATLIGGAVLLRKRG